MTTNLKKSKPRKHTSKKGNQYMVDPRQALFISKYVDPKSPSFSNALQSALAAGYSQLYAENLTSQMPVWLSEKLGEAKSNANKMLQKAERNLDEILDLPNKVQAMGAFGPIFEKTKNGKKVPVMTYATSLIKVKNDASQFVAERLGKGKYGEDAPVAPVTNNIVQIVIHTPHATEARNISNA